MVKGVIFDMDGLMFDTERLWDTLWEPACAALGLPLPADMEKFKAGGRGLAGDNLRRHVAEIKTAIGREQIILKSGAKIKFLARTRNGGRGQHGDLLIFDEAQELDDFAYAALLPTISVVGFIVVRIISVTRFSFSSKVTLSIWLPSISTAM